MLKLIFAFIFGIFLSFAIGVNSKPVYGNSDITDRLEELRDKRKQKQEDHRKRLQELKQNASDRREKAASRVAEIKEKINDRLVFRIEGIIARAIRRLNAALARLDNVALRIASRIEKLNERGVDTTDAEAALLKAEEAGAAAAQSIADAESQLAALNTDEATIREVVMEVKVIVRIAKASLKEYHKSLVETIRLLKASDKVVGNGESEDAE